jgi:hypothetical protein
VFATTRTWPFLASAAVVLAAALVHGLWTDRWGKPRALAEAAAVLQSDRMPGDLGPWKAQPSDLDADAVQSAGAEGGWSRLYRHQRSGETAVVLLLCGRAGRISTHRPEHCYRSAGYEMLSEQPLRHDLKDARGAVLGQFWTDLFRKQEAEGPVQLRIWWSFFAGRGPWSAPEDARLSYAAQGETVLYKLYVIRNVPLTQEGLDDAGLDLLRRLTPALSAALAAP